MSRRTEPLTTIPTEPFEPSELQRLKCFNDRFKELFANFDDLRNSGFNLNGGFELARNGVVESNCNLGVSRFRIKGFLVDYRHFHGQEEPAQFLAILKLIQRRCRDDRLLRRLKDIRKDWDAAGTLSGWHNDFTLDEVVDAVFKEDVFHSTPKGKKIRVRLHDVETKLSASAMWYELAYMTYSRMQKIRNVNWIIAPVITGKNEVRIPE